MIWSAFYAEVMGLIGPEGERAGNELALAGWIRAALLDLQDKVPALTIGHETIYSESDFVQDGCAGRGVFPSGMLQFVDAWVIQHGDTSVEGEEADDVMKRWPVMLEPWPRRFEFVHGQEGYYNSARIIPDPQQVTFYMWPYIEDDERYRLSINWNGKKADFGDDEATPFDSDVAIAVSEWVLAYAKRSIENDIQMYASHMGSYAAKRRDLFVAGARKFSLP